MDPLSVLREFASEQKLDQVVVDGTRIEYVLPSLSFNRKGNSFIPQKVEECGC